MGVESVSQDVLPLALRVLTVFSDIFDIRLPMFALSEDTALVARSV